MLFSAKFLKLPLRASAAVALLATTTLIAAPPCYPQYRSAQMRGQSTRRPKPQQEQLVDFLKQVRARSAALATELQKKDELISLLQQEQEQQRHFQASACKQIQQELNHKLELLALLEETNAKLEQRVTELSAANQEYVTKHQTELQQLMADNAALRIALEQSQRGQSTLSQEVNQLRSEVSEVSRDSYRKQVAELESVLALRDTQIETLTTRLATMQESWRQEKEHCEALSHVLCGQSEQLCTLLTTVDQKKSELSTALDSMEQNAQEKAHFEKIVVERTAEIDQLQEAIGQLQEELETYKAIRDVVRGELQQQCTLLIDKLATVALPAKVEPLTAQLREERVANGILKDRCAELSQEALSLQQLVFQQEQQIATLTKDLADRESALAEAQTIQEAWVRVAKLHEENENQSAPTQVAGLK